MSDPARAELAALVAAHDEHGGNWLPVHEEAWHNALKRARTFLAAPTPPADGEAEELAANLESVAGHLSDIGCACYADYVNSAADYVENAAALLREARPQPVPVAQRLPGPEDCDAEGRVWVCERNRDMTPQWNLLRSKCASTNYGTTHWLPYWAIPIPTEPTTPTEQS